MAPVEADATYRSPDPELTVFFDADCGFCSWCAIALERLDARHRLRLVPLQSATHDTADPPEQNRLVQALHVKDRRGRWERGGRACLRIAAEVPALWPLALVGRVPILSGCVEPLYGLVARNRHRAGRLLGVGTCTYPAARR